MEKKKIAIFLIIGTLLFSLSSCSKEEIRVDDNPTAINQNYKESGGVPGGQTLYSYSQFYYNWECQCMIEEYIFIFCAWPNRNCLPTVVITPSSDYSISKEADQFLFNYNNSSIESYFSGTSYKLLFPGVDSLNGVVDSIVNGQIIIHKFYNSHDTTNYFIGLPYGTELTDDWDEWIPEASCVLRLKDER